MLKLFKIFNTVSVSSFLDCIGAPIVVAGTSLSRQRTWAKTVLPNQTLFTGDRFFFSSGPVVI